MGRSVNSPAHLAVEPLHRTPGLGLSLVRCRFPARHAGREEASSDHEVSFPRGGVYVKERGRERVVADPTRVVFYHRGEPYRVSHPVPGGDTTFVIALGAADAVEAMRERDPAAEERPEHPFARAHAPCPPRAYLLQRALEDSLRRRMVEPLEAQERVLELLDALPVAPPGRRSARRPGTARARRDTVAAAQAFLAVRFRERLGLAAIAAAVASSPFHLARIFREYVGTTLHAYQTRLRLRAALERIADGEPDLARLAAELGLADHAHLTRAFRREFGRPPSQVRSRELRTFLQA
jgi:AraC-like DNA-binding protein